MHLYEVIVGNMNKKVYMICVIALALLIPAGSVFAASAADELASERKLMDMERRILVDKLATQRESFEDKARRLETKVIQLESDLKHVTNGSDKRIDDLRSHLNERVNDTRNMIWGIVSIFGIILAILGYFGWDTTKKNIQTKVEGLAEEKVRELVTEDLTRNIIEEKGGPLIKQIIDEIKEKAHQKIEELREEMKKLVETGMSKPLSEIEKQNLEAYVKSILITEKEEQYTYDDWVLKGYKEFNDDNYKTAIDFYKRAIEINETAIATGNLALAMYHAGKVSGVEDVYKRSLELDSDSVTTLINYAVFQKNVIKNYERAEELYKRAINLGTDDAYSTGHYAVFLQCISNDYVQAEKHYKLSMDLGNQDPSLIGNYAGLLLLQEDKKDAFIKLKKAMSLAQDNTLMLELLFYSYAHEDDEAGRNHALREIKKLIIEGVRSPNFDMSLNVERGIEDRHPNPGLLTDIELVISAGKDVKDLEKYEQWKQA